MEFSHSSKSSKASSSSNNNNNNNRSSGKSSTPKQADDHHLLPDMPEVFQFQFMPSDLEAVLSEILEGSSVSTALSALAQHVGNNIEPVGWKAVWQPTPATIRKLAFPPGGVSLRVNVLNVFYHSLSASVTVSELLHPRVEALTEAEKCALLPLFLGQRQFQQRPITVHLRELYVISESREDAHYYNTAFLIELVRFFHRHVWRPWDHLEEEGDGSSAGAHFVVTRLVPRLKMFWEMKNGIISKGFIRRVEAILAEGTALRDQLDELTERLETPAIERRRKAAVVVVVKEELLDDDDEPEEGDDGDGDESASEGGDTASETDARAFVLLKNKLLELEREMAIIEDGLTRSLYHELLPHKAELINEEEEDEEGEEDIVKPPSKTFHLVTKKSTLNTISVATAKLTKVIGVVCTVRLFLSFISKYFTFTPPPQLCRTTRSATCR